MQNILTSFADNKALMDAVKGVIKSHLVGMTPTGHTMTNDQVLGQIYRAQLTGLQALEEAFKEIERSRSPITIEPRSRVPR
jgi:hypothetical protein